MIKFSMGPYENENGTSYHIGLFSNNHVLVAIYFYNNEFMSSLCLKMYKFHMTFGMDLW